MDERHEHLARPKPPLTDIVLHDGVAARETVLVPEAVEDALRSVPLLVVAGPIVFQDPIDDPRERTQLRPPRRLALRRYPGGTENDSILRTVLRSSPNTREASRVLIPSTRHARRTRAYISTRYIPPPSSQSNPDRRLYAVPFWSAAAGSTGRFSGGLLRRRSQPWAGSRANAATAEWAAREGWQQSDAVVGRSEDWSAHQKETVERIAKLQR